MTGLTLDKTYIADYADNTSSAYKELAEEIEEKVLILLQSRPETSNASITGAKVKAMTNGSVLVDMTIASSGATLPLSSIESSINNGIASGNLSSLSASGTITVQGRSYVVSLIPLSLSIDRCDLCFLSSFLLNYLNLHLCCCPSFVKARKFYDRFYFIILRSH